MPWNPEAEKICERTFYEAEYLCRKTVHYVQQLDNNPAEVLMAAIAATGGALKTLAELIAAGSEGDNIEGKGNKENALVAALLVARVAIPSEDGVSMLFDPRNFTAAVKAAELVAGRSLKPYLNKGMVDYYATLTEQKEMTTGYWDYLQDVGPTFSGFSQQMTNFTRH